MSFSIRQINDVPFRPLKLETDDSEKFPISFVIAPSEFNICQRVVLFLLYRNADSIKGIKATSGLKYFSVPKTVEVRISSVYS